MGTAERRVWRLASATAAALALAYALALPFAFLAPLLAFLAALRPAPPPGLRGVLLLAAMVALTSAAGLWLVPVLQHHPLTGVLLVALGVHLSFLFTLRRGQGLLGLFTALGFTLISAAGYSSFELGLELVESLVLAVGIAMGCLRLAHAFFPETEAPPAPGAPPAAGDVGFWMPLRGTAVVLPVYLLALNNPGLFLAAVMKAVSLGQQPTLQDARAAGRELLGSTLAGGALAVAFWAALAILPTLWTFFLWTLAFAGFAGRRIQGLAPTRHPPSWWVNAFITMLILLGPAVSDAAGGEDVYAAFASRMALFVLVTLYAWGALALIDGIRAGRRKEGVCC